MASVDGQRLSDVLRDTLSMLCRNSVTFQQQLSIQGLLAVTVDTTRVIVLQVDESVEKKNDGSVRVINGNSCPPQGCSSCKCGCPCLQSSSYSRSKTRTKLKSKANSSMENSNSDKDGCNSDWAGSSADEMDVKHERVTERGKEKDEERMGGDPGPFIAGVVPGMALLPRHITPAHSQSSKFPMGQLASFTTLAQDIKLGAVGEHWNANQVISNAVTSSVAPSVTAAPITTQPLSVVPTEEPEMNHELSPPSVLTTSYHSSPRRQLSPRSARAERARQYRQALKSNPALHEKYEEIKRKNRERMRRHRQLVQHNPTHNDNYVRVNSLGDTPKHSIPLLMSSSLASIVQPGVPCPTVSPASSDSERLWQDIHTWQSQPLLMSQTTMGHRTQQRSESLENDKSANTDETAEYK